MDTIFGFQDNMTTYVLTVTALTGVAYLWHRQRESPAAGLLQDLHATVPLSVSVNNTEAARDLSRSLASESISVVVDGGLRAPLTNVLESADLLPDLIAHWFPDASFRQVTAACLPLLSVGGVLSLLEQSELPNSVHERILQPHYLLTVETGRSLKVSLFGFVLGPISGERPDSKFTPFALRMHSTNLLGEAPGVTISVTSSNGMQSSIDLISFK